MQVFMGVETGNKKASGELAFVYLDDDVFIW